MKVNGTAVNRIAYFKISFRFILFYSKVGVNLLATAEPIKNSAIKN